MAESAPDRLDVALRVSRAVSITETEFLDEFARIMHEWGFAPFRYGQVSFPTLAEARSALARSRYTWDDGLAA